MSSKFRATVSVMSVAGQWLLVRPWRTALTAVIAAMAVFTTVAVVAIISGVLH